MSTLRLFTICLLFILSACTQGSIENGETLKPEQNMNIKINVTAKDGKLLSEITEYQKAKNIISIIETRKPMFEKMMPIFKMELVIEKDGNKEAWLFAKPKYLRQKSSESSQVYYVEEYEKLTDLMFH